jgi:hypothetical protein
VADQGAGLSCQQPPQAGPASCLQSAVGQVEMQENRSIDSVEVIHSGNITMKKDADLGCVYIIA